MQPFPHTASCGASLAPSPQPPAMPDRAAPTLPAIRSAGRMTSHHRSFAFAGTRPAWCPGRGPDPAPAFLVRWHLADGTTCHHPAATETEAWAFARDASDSARTEAAIYRLYNVLPG